MSALENGRLQIINQDAALEWLREQRDILVSSGIADDSYEWLDREDAFEAEWSVSHGHFGTLKHKSRVPAFEISSDMDDAALVDLLLGRVEDSIRDSVNFISQDPDHVLGLINDQKAEADVGFEDQGDLPSP